MNIVTINNKFILYNEEINIKSKMIFSFMVTKRLEVFGLKIWLYSLYSPFVYVNAVGLLVFIKTILILIN